MKRRSLKKQFFSNSAFVVMAVMVISVLLVDLSYVKELEKSAQERLRLHVYTLLSVAQFEQGKIWVPTILYNQRFNQSGSGLWAAVLDNEKSTQWRSLSLHHPLSKINVPKSTGTWLFEKKIVNEQQFFTAGYKIVWSDQDEYEFYFLVGEDSSVVDGEVRRFRWMLFTGFLVITLSLLVGQAIVLKLAFRPISRLESEIAAMDEGVQDQLSSDYPKELHGVTRNLNTLVDKEYQQRERYRSSMADLAHSLKTPITVLNGELSKYPENKSMQNALSRIDSSIEYQLRRAVISGHSVLNKGAQIEQVLNLVVEAMDKIYSDKSIAITLDTDETQYFSGDENDLMEILGNLLDNAYKYANKKVYVAVGQSEDKLTLMVEDDGEGFDSTESLRIFSRGERLDQKGLGQGIGLAVVYDIVTSYQGNISASRSRLGGALFQVEFPSKESIE